MSTLQVANLHFESTGNNRIQFTGANSFVMVTAGSNALLVNTSVVTVQSANLFFDSTGNNRIQSGSNTILFVVGGANTLIVNSTSSPFTNSVTTTIGVGYTVAPYNIGTLTSGTTTLNPALGNYQYYTNNGAHTIAAPTSDCAIDILVTNGATAGAITLSGFTVGSLTGSTYATTNANRFILNVRRINGISTYSWYALQ